MIRSMTGYGRTESVLEGKKIVLEIKSLNHKNLEIGMRIPSFLNPLEVDIRKRISEKISRGKIEVNIRLNSDSTSSSIGKLEANLPVIRNYFELLTKIKQEFGIKDDISLNMLTRLKDSITYSEDELDIEEAKTIIEEVVDKSLSLLIEMRELEGRVLYKDFITRLNMIANHLEKLKLRTPLAVQEYEKRLSDKIIELTEGLALDESRLNQEVAIMAEKSDITEELVRFASHIHQFEEMLASDGSAVGRKVDFLLQEMHREINTIGSKSNDMEISLHVIEIKSEISKIREQIQNIE